MEIEEAKIRPKERAADQERIVESELFDDVLLHARRCCRGQCEDGQAVEALLQPGEVPVGRAKVVAPLADAVGLVDRD